MQATPLLQVLLEDVLQLLALQVAGAHAQSEPAGTSHRGLRVLQMQQEGRQPTYHLVQEDVLAGPVARLIEVAEEADGRGAELCLVAVKEGPGPDGHVQQHSAQLPCFHQLHQPRQARHGLQSHQAVCVVPVVQPANHGCEQLGAVSPHLVRGARGDVGHPAEHQPPHTGTGVLLPGCQAVQQRLEERQVVCHAAAQQLGQEGGGGDPLHLIQAALHACQALHHQGQPGACVLGHGTGQPGDPLFVPCRSPEQCPASLQLHALLHVLAAPSEQHSLQGVHCRAAGLEAPRSRAGTPPLLGLQVPRQLDTNSAADPQQEGHKQLWVELQHGGRRRRGRHDLTERAGGHKGQQCGHTVRRGARQEGPALLEGHVLAHLVQEQSQDRDAEAGLHSQCPPQGTGVAVKGQGAAQEAGHHGGAVLGGQQVHAVLGGRQDVLLPRLPQLAAQHAHDLGDLL